MGLRGRLTPLSLVVLSCRSVAALRTLVSVGFDLLGGEPQLVLIVEDECLTRHDALHLMGFACERQGNATPSCGEAFVDEFASLVSTRQLARRGGDVTFKFDMDGGAVVVRTHPGHVTVGDMLCEQFKLSAQHVPPGQCERLKAYVAEAVAEPRRAARRRGHAAPPPRLVRDPPEVAREGGVALRVRRRRHDGRARRVARVLPRGPPQRGLVADEAGVRRPRRRRRGERRRPLQPQARTYVAIKFRAPHAIDATSSP